MRGESAESILPLTMTPKIYNVKTRHPSLAVLVDRTTPWGNRFVIGKHGTRDEVCDKFDCWAYEPEQEELRDRARRELRGRNLLCHCAPERCHAETWLRIANQVIIIGKIISGGQTGADIAGLRAAICVGIPTGGYATKGFKTERGHRPTLGSLYGLTEHESDRYEHRTLANLMASDCTLIIATSMDGGSLLTRNLCFKYHRPAFWVSGLDLLDTGTSLGEVAEWIRARYKNKRRPLTINIAGNRESKQRGMEQDAKRFLINLFERIQ